MYPQRPVQLIVLKMYLDIISVVHKVSGRYGRALEISKSEMAGLG